MLRVAPFGQSGVTDVSTMMECLDETGQYGKSYQPHGPALPGCSLIVCRVCGMHRHHERPSLTLTGHVNNIMYNRFAESSRVGYFRNFTAAVDAQYKQAWIDLMTPKAVGLILKSIKTDYKFVRAPLRFWYVLKRLTYPPKTAAGVSRHHHSPAQAPLSARSRLYEH